MRRTVAVIWHASFSIAAGVLYFFFVLPRWPELLGDTPHTLGTVLRIVAGRADRTGRAAGGVHAAAHSSAGVRHACAGADAADRVDRPACAGRRPDHRHRDQRDLALAGRRGAVAVRHLRRRRGDRAARRVRVLPGLRRRAAAASAEAAQAEGSPSSAAAGKASEAEQEDSRGRRTTETRGRGPSEETADGRAESERPGRSRPRSRRRQRSRSRRPRSGSTARKSPPSERRDRTRAPSEAESTNGKLRNRRPSGKTEPTRRRRRRSRGGVVRRGLGIAPSGTMGSWV